MFSRKFLLSVFTFLLVSVSLSFSFPHSPTPNPQPLSSVHPPSTIRHSPFSFTENKGQWDTRVLYKCNARNGMTWFLERDGVTLLTCIEDKTQPALPVPGTADLPVCMQKHPARYPMKSHALKFKFLATSNVGAQLIAPAGRINATPTLASPQSIEPYNELPWHNNYFLGNDSTKWAPNCRNYTNIVYRDVWDGIDIEWYEENGKLEFDFVVQPGADPSQIRMSCDGLDGELSFDSRGGPPRPPAAGERSPSSLSFPTTHNLPPTTGAELLLPTSLGELRTALPQVYQISPGGSRSEVDAKFEITNKNEFGITLPNGYEKEHTLRIDPLIYSTYLGGSGSEGAQDIVNDGSGGVIITGITYSTNFPLTLGAFDTTNISGICFITRLNNTGSQLIFSTFLGGFGYSEGKRLISDDSSGIIIAGLTDSLDFPTTTGAYDRTYHGLGDCFITRLNSTGSQLIFSTFLGGSGIDIAYGIAGDGNGGVYITGATGSNDFPVTDGSPYQGGSDCFVTHLNNTGSQLLFSSYLGGSGNDEAYGIVSNDGGIVTVTGYTSSNNFPHSSNAFQTTLHGTQNVFIARLNLNSSTLVYGTYLGGAGNDIGNGIINVDSGEVVVIGNTSSSNFPTTTGALDTTYNGGLYSGDCFVTRLNDTGTRLVYSTYLGGSGSEYGGGIVRNGSNGVIITGLTNSTNFPTTAGAFSDSMRGIHNCFITNLNSTGSQLRYSTYFGGTGNDAGSKAVSDGNGGVILTGGTGSADFPITHASYDTSFNGASDCFVSHLAFDSSDVATIKGELLYEYSLRQNYPNPFNSFTTIEYSLPKYSTVKLELYDLLGRRISTLINSPQNAGVHHVRFDGKNLASGEYFYRLSAGDFQETKKLLLLK